MRRILDFIMLGLTITGVLTFAQTFTKAFFNNYEITININKYGEANIEMVFVILSIVGTLYVVYRLLEDGKL